MKIEFENSVRRLSFLYCLMNIKIAWMNPWKDYENFMAVIMIWRSLIYIKKTKEARTDPCGTPKTLCFRVKFIYCYKLLSVRKVERKSSIGYISYSILWKFMEQYVMFYCIKCLLQVNKDSTNKLIYCLFNIFNKANYCMCSRKFFLKSKLFLAIESFGHSKIPLAFYA